MSPIDGYLKVQANVTLGGRCEKALEGPPRCGHETADRHDKKRRRAGFRRGDSASMADAAEARRVFGAPGQGGNLSSVLTKTLWTALVGMLTDPFGEPCVVSVAALKA